MPVYEYTCQECQRNFELLVRSSATEIACPGCRSHQVKKRISSFNSNTGAQPEMSGGCGNCPPGGCGWN